MPADRKRLFALMAFLFVPAFPAFAQQSPLWQGSPRQGSRVQQPTTPAPPTQEPRLPIAPQLSLPPETQADGEAHPQMMEMPAAQAPTPLSPQPVPSPQQSAAVARSLNLPAQPVYLGVAGQTAPTCRYPAGVRVTRVIEGSPAHQAGLQGEGTLSWKHAVAGVLALSPAAPLVLPFLSESKHGGYGDLILAVDGKRIHNRDELEQELGRFRPGDVVYFSVLRGESGLRQIPVHLTDYPGSTPMALHTSTAKSAPGL